MTHEDYAVIRLEDLLTLKDPRLLRRLAELLALANSSRKMRGLDPLHTLVVESTDPGYTAALGALANRRHPADITIIQQEEEQP